MPAAYFRVSPQFWTDPIVRSWDHDTQLIALYVLTSPHRVTEGLFRLPVSYATADTGYTAKKVERALAAMESGGVIERDGEYVLLVSALKWQAPRSEANATHAARQVMGMHTPLLGRLLALADEHSDKLAEAMRREIPTLESSYA